MKHFQRTARRGGIQSDKNLSGQDSTHTSHYVVNSSEVLRRERTLTKKSVSTSKGFIFTLAIPKLI